MECGLPCDVEKSVSGDKFHRLSDDESSEILEYMFGFTMFYFCEKHYDDQFEKYSRIWHIRKCADPAKSLAYGKLLHLMKVFVMFLGVHH